MAIFKCPKCNKEIITYKYSSYYKDNKEIQMNDETDKELICENCKEKLIQIIERKSLGSIGIGRFSGLSIEERQNVLKKRSKDDAIKMKYKDQEREKVFYNG